jgi:hypothetical protein
MSKIIFELSWQQLQVKESISSHVTESIRDSIESKMKSLITYEFLPPMGSIFNLEDWTEYYKFDDNEMDLIIDHDWSWYKVSDIHILPNHVKLSLEPLI